VDGVSVVKGGRGRGSGDEEAICFCRALDRSLVWAGTKGKEEWWGR